MVELIRLRGQVALDPGVEEGDGHHLGSIPLTTTPSRRPCLAAHRGTMSCAAAVAVATRVALPVLAVAAVVVDGKGVSGVEEAGGGGEGCGLGLGGGRLPRVSGEGVVEGGVVHEGTDGGGEVER